MKRQILRKEMKWIREKKLKLLLNRHENYNWKFQTFSGAKICAFSRLAMRKWENYWWNYHNFSSQHHKDGNFQFFTCESILPFVIITITRWKRKKKWFDEADTWKTSMTMNRKLGRIRGNPVIEQCSELGSNRMFQHDENSVYIQKHSHEIKFLIWKDKTKTICRLTKQANVSAEQIR